MTGAHQKLMNSITKGVRNYYKMESMLWMLKIYFTKTWKIEKRIKFRKRRWERWYLSTRGIDWRTDEQEERLNIYEGAKITKNESNLLIMSFIIRHNITYYGLEDLLEFINCRSSNTIQTSKYLFSKSFPETASFKTFFYCPDCLAPIQYKGNA